jgi:hypothetical protein
MDPGAQSHICYGVVRFFSHRTSGAGSLAAGLYPFCLLLGFPALSPDPKSSRRPGPFSVSPPNKTFGKY